MEKNSTQQEILLLTGTSFSSRQCFEQEDTDSPGRLSERQQLEQACWDGLLSEFLPEICSKPLLDKKIYLWKVKEALAFLELDLGEFPVAKDQQFSIDPYAFLELQGLN
jgi:hypothetical protein